MPYISRMRTTLDIDGDILEKVKKMAVVRKTTAGKVLSELARTALEGPGYEEITWRNGFPQLPPTGRPIRAEDVENLIDDELKDYL